MSLIAAPPSGTAASPPPPPPLKAPFLYRARGMFGALVSLNMLVAGYMLIRGPRSGHAKRNATEDLEERVRRDDVLISEIEQKLNLSDAAEVPKDVAPPASSRPREQPHVVTDPLPHSSDDRHAMSIASDVLVDSSQNISEQVEHGYNNVVASHPPDCALPDGEVRELLQWVLDEKIRMRPRSWVERSQINSDKRYLKQVLKEASLPQIQ